MVFMPNRNKVDNDNDNNNINNSNSQNLGVQLLRNSNDCPGHHLRSKEVSPVPLWD